ncbi:hypothetical protein HF521_010198 [Silurus meridionalis]|uniref:Guanylate-binding protein/Atlastin C-terminal domain-containing protein n=1 Tax=Silurus meridionalis TaxID=175797 RepID=A0A8T0AIZ9_SILME|nr:hypothetical protein HF521_010198 [Silurus meridionalis]
MNEIQTVYQHLCDRNRKEGLNTCKLELEQVFAPLETAISDGSFMRPGGYKQYRDKLQSLTNVFEARTHKQRMSEEVLTEYLKEKDEFGRNILLADNCLTEAEHKKEVERLQKEALERQNESLKKSKELQEQILRDQQRTNEQHTTQLLKRMEEESQRERANNERVLEAKLRVTAALLSLADYIALPPGFIDNVTPPLGFAKMFAQPLVYTEVMVYAEGLDGIDHRSGPDFRSATGLRRGRCSVADLCTTAVLCKGRHTIPAQKASFSIITSGKKGRVLILKLRISTCPGGVCITFSQNGDVLSALCSLAEVYVEAICSGQIPCLENAVEALAQIQNERAVEQGLQAYQSQLSESVCFPLDPSELSDIHRKAEMAAIDVFIRTSFNDTEQKAQLKLKKEIQTVYQHLCDRNRKESLNICKRELVQVFAPLETAISDGSFMRPGGYKQYRDHLQRLTYLFKARTHKQWMDEFGRNILLADKCLTEAEHKKEVERLQKVALEWEIESLKKSKELQEQILRDQQKTNKQHMTQLLKRMDEEIQRERANNERVLEAKLREQAALLERGFNEKANKMNREIVNLKRQMNSRKESTCLIL